MRRGRKAKQITRRQYTLLAALLLADGEWVAREDLAWGLFEQPMTLQAISIHAANLRRFGVVLERHYGWGYRLTTLPPDERLDSVLACVPTVKRSAWWTIRRSQIRMTA